MPAPMRTQLVVADEDVSAGDVGAEIVAELARHLLPQVVGHEASGARAELGRHLTAQWGRPLAPKGRQVDTEFVRVPESAEEVNPDAAHRLVQSLQPFDSKNLSLFRIVTTTWPELLPLSMIEPMPSPPVRRAQ